MEKKDYSQELLDIIEYNTLMSIGMDLPELVYNHIVKTIKDELIENGMDEKDITENYGELYSMICEICEIHFDFEPGYYEEN